MKLEKELVREILLAVEAHDKPQGWMKLTLNGRSSEEISYHVMLLDEAGLVSGISLGGINHFEWQPRRLTYKGHEFLDTVRDGEVCSGQLIPDTALSFSSATAGAKPSLN
ncbi:DUF2513 domain-containing protein [Pseudomonas eucalypticola]|uniref:DUF2513 domain-containing protein n=1 Tax=Pseudomonas eucalypticola TaxID=2599595 RepID=A0A7D5D8U6_9PSED|nr:DUF2513 domain-containing protein [Pseudomonas eucalypticola]QKZ05820.1 DUF2513 domain-containing protein [Pseudomonas eucalypticola]